MNETRQTDSNGALPSDTLVHKTEQISDDGVSWRDISDLMQRVQAIETKLELIAEKNDRSFTIIVAIASAVGGGVAALISTNLP